MTWEGNKIIVQIQGASSAITTCTPPMFQENILYVLSCLLCREARWELYFQASANPRIFCLELQRHPSFKLQASQHDKAHASFMNDNHARLSPALVETIAGLAAGTISTLAVHPLDVIKTRLQSTSPPQPLSTNTNFPSPTQ